MYEYKYVYQDTGGGCEHRATIGQHARDGWRYVGFLPTEFTGHGGISGIDLIFERVCPKCEE